MCERLTGGNSSEGGRGGGGRRAFGLRCWPDLWRSKGWREGRVAGTPHTPGEVLFRLILSPRASARPQGHHFPSMLGHWWEPLGMLGGPGSQQQSCQSVHHGPQYKTHRAHGQGQHTCCICHWGPWSVKAGRPGNSLLPYTPG